MRPFDLLARSGSKSGAYAAIMGVSAVAIVLALPPGGVGMGVGSFWWIALASTAVLGSLACSAGPWSATGAYAAVFWCFHFGLVAVVGFGLVQPADMSLWDQSWALGPFASDAALVSLAGSMAFASGAAWVYAWRHARTDRSFAATSRAGAHPHGTAGSLLVFATIGLWCGVVAATSGLGGFFGSYAEYLQATSELSVIMSGVWLGLGCGIVLAVTGRDGWMRTSAIAGFAGVALVALPLGLRGEIMFPSIAAIVASARCGRVLSWRKACALVAGLLVLIPVIREVRSTGLQGLPDMAMELRLFDAFVEMGGSLHPVEKVVRWQAEGDPLDRGGSYWAPIERAAARILPGLVSTAAEDDMRIMNVLVTDRVGAIGFSPVAEAYRNFGAAGVVVVLGLLGAALACIDKVADRQIAALAIATLYVPLLTNVRNSFVSVPVQCALGVLFVLVLVAMRHVSSSVLSRPYARPTYVRSKV